MSTELTVIEEAVVALGMREREQELVALAESSKTITTITNPAGYQQAHAARMVLKNERVQITKLAKEARDRANSFCKACISEERRIIGLIEPEEKRLEALQKAWDDAREAERREKAEAEARRVATIQARIENISSSVLRAAGKSSAEIWVISAEIESLEIDESFAEFRAQAETARATVIERLREMSAAAEAHEAEQDRIRQEREELARLREEQARRETEERTRRAEEERRAQEQRDREAAEQRRVANLKDRLADLKAQATIPSDWPASKIEAQFKLVESLSTDASVWQEFAEEAATARHDVLAALKSLHAAALRREAEDKRIREQQAELERQRQEQARQQAEIDRRERETREAEERRIAAERAEQQRKDQEAADRRAREERRQKALENPPPAMDIVKTVAEGYGVDLDVAMEWLTTLDFSDLPESEAA